MKNILSIVFILSLFHANLPGLAAQKVDKKIQTEEFTVNGVCGMCEKRIEKAALIPGVMSATWDQDTEKLTILYKAKKVTLQKVKTAVANAGHDTDETKAPDKVYASLPDCCAYRDGVKSH